MEEKGRDHERLSPLITDTASPNAPPLPGSWTSICRRKGLIMDGLPLKGHSCVPTVTIDMWERMFDEGYRTDVTISTDNDGVIHAHACVLGMASPVLKNMLRQTKSRRRRKLISIHGVPHQAVRVFIRFLYSSRYDQIEMNEFALPLLVLSHVYVIPLLKRECERQLEKGMLTTENVVDIFQLSLLCDSPRLSLFCHRLIVKNFKVISTTEGWKVMKQSHPILEKELIETVIESDSRNQERLKKLKNRKTYLQLYEAMEALVHICRDGCRTIGPHDKVLKGDQPPCSFVACKGLELLVRHFASCKLRVPGGCAHCKRMWQLLELHSRLCSEPTKCRVPLCRNFKERLQQQSKKDEVKWKLLVQNIIRAKKISGASFVSPASAVYA